MLGDANGPGENPALSHTRAPRLPLHYEPITFLLLGDAAIAGENVLHYGRPQKSELRGTFCEAIAETVRLVPYLLSTTKNAPIERYRLDRNRHHFLVCILERVRSQFWHAANG